MAGTPELAGDPRRPRRPGARWAAAGGGEGGAPELARQLGHGRRPRGGPGALVLDGQQPVADEGSPELARQLGDPGRGPRGGPAPDRQVPVTGMAGTPSWPVTRGGPGALVLDGRQPVAVEGSPGARPPAG